MLLAPHRLGVDSVFVLLMFFFPCPYLFQSGFDILSFHSVNHLCLHLPIFFLCIHVIFSVLTIRASSSDTLLQMNPISILEVNMNLRSFSVCHRGKVECVSVLGQRRCCRPRHQRPSQVRRVFRQIPAVVIPRPVPVEGRWRMS